MARGRYEFTPGVPPAEIRLWAAGDIPTDYGVHRWTERSAAEVLAEYERRGNPLQIDVEHNQADKVRAENEGFAPAEEPTGGYARLELRAGEPWLVFDWSSFAVEQLQSKQRRFLSPEYLVDPDTKEVTRLVRVSLVGDPATHGAPILASREAADMAYAAARTARRASALRCATAWAAEPRTTATAPVSEVPAGVLEIVRKAPLSWEYEDPQAVGGWLGAIEPIDESWIAFVAVDGKVLLWTERESEGGVVGAPALLWRFDLAQWRAARPGTVSTTMLARTAGQQGSTGVTMNDMDVLKALLAAAIGATTAADPDIQAMGVSVSQAVTGLASSKGLDLSGAAVEPAPASQEMAGAMPEKPEPQMAAACEADKVQAAAAVKKDEDAKVAASKKAAEDAKAVLAAAGGSVGAGGITVETARSIAREESERAQLITANAAVLGPMAGLLAGKPLAEVKAFVAAASTQAAKAAKAEAAEGKAPRGGELGTVTASRPISISEKYMNGKKPAAAIP